MSTELNELSDDHPLVLELSSLRQIAARFQVLHSLGVSYIVSAFQSLIIRVH